MCVYIYICRQWEIPGRRRPLTHTAFLCGPRPLLPGPCLALVLPGRLPKQQLLSHLTAEGLTSNYLFPLHPEVTRTTIPKAEFQSRNKEGTRATIHEIAKASLELQNSVCMSWMALDCCLFELLIRFINSCLMLTPLVRFQATCVYGVICLTALYCLFPYSYTWLVTRMNEKYFLSWRIFKWVKSALDTSKPYTIMAIGVSMKC